MTAIELLNLALLKIGVSQGITALDEASREAYTGALVYDHHLRACLRQFPWPFATKYETLTLTRGPAWTDAPVQAWVSSSAYAIGDVVVRSSVNYYCILAHSNQVPPNATYWSTTETEYANADWTWGYRWPADCLFARRLAIQSIGRAFSPSPAPFRVGRDDVGQVIWTAEQDAVLEYTAVDCDALWSDDLFLDAFTWRLASVLAPSLSRNNITAAEGWKMYLHALDTAAAVASREQQQHTDRGDPDWIRDR